MKKILTNKLIWTIILITYVLLLFLFVILKLYTPQGSIVFTRNLILQNRLDGYWNYNFIPFRSIQSYFDFKNGINYKNIFGNTIPFMLLGILLSLSLQNKFKIFKLLT